MPAYKHWRLVFGGNWVHAGYSQLREVAFLDATGADVSVGGVAAASHAADHLSGADRAFDKSYDTRWSSGTQYFPHWLQYAHTAPVDVRHVRLTLSNDFGTVAPASPSDMTVMAWGGDAAYWPPRFGSLSLESGTFAKNAEVLLSVQLQAEFAEAAREVGLAGSIQGRVLPRYSGAAGAGLVSGLGRDWRFFSDTGGTVLNNNRVMVKPSASAPEAPFAGARVRLHRLADGYCAWEGISDAAGYYWPRGLEVGAAYYPVAIDLSGVHECDAAGPVIAVRAP